VRLPHQIAGIAERERDHRWPRRQRVAERLGIQCRRDMVHRKIAIGQLFHHVNVTLDGGGRSKQRSDAAQRAFVRRSRS
jgi:hypothetical protein